MNDPFAGIAPVPVDAGNLAGFTHDQEFMVVAVDLLGEVASYATVASCIMGTAPQWSRDRAAVGGNVVRLVKLLHGFLDQVCQKRGETSLIVSRLVFETVITVKYLIQHFSHELVDSYVRHSLVHERKLWNEIDANVAARSGEVQPIEVRMRKSLLRAARVAGVPLESVDLKHKKPWGGKSVYAKAEAVGLDEAYLAMFSGMSHDIHGAWQNISHHHLEADDAGGFTPNLEWTRPRPQVCAALGVVTLSAVSDFVSFMAGEDLHKPIFPRLDDLSMRIRQADAAHEKYLQGKRWPET